MQNNTHSIETDKKTIVLIPIDEILKTFGNRVKEERKKKGITQAQLAECICVSDDTVKRLESGKGVKLDVAYHIAMALELPLESLLPPQNTQPKYKLVEKFYAIRDNAQSLIDEYEENKLKKND